MPDLQWLHRFLGTTKQQFVSPLIIGGSRTVCSAAIVCLSILLAGVAIMTVLLSPPESTGSVSVPCFLFH